MCVAPCRKRLVENCTRRLTDGDIQNVLAQCRVALATERGGTGRGEAEGWMGGRQRRRVAGRGRGGVHAHPLARDAFVRSFVRSFQHISRCGVAVARSLAGRARKMAGRFRLT